jgi:hypothetical protein
MKKKMMIIEKMFHEMKEINLGRINIEEIEMKSLERVRIEVKENEMIDQEIETDQNTISLRVKNLEMKEIKDL